MVAGGVRNVFTCSTFERGHGVGAWLGGLFRRILPYVTSGALAVGKETLRADIKVLDDVANTGVNFKEAVKTRAGESGRNLKRKAAEKISEIMKGSGYKTTRRSKRRRHSRKTYGTARPARTKRKRVVKTSDRRKSRQGGRKNKKIPIFRSVGEIFGPK